MKTMERSSQVTIILCAIWSDVGLSNFFGKEVVGGRQNHINENDEEVFQDA